MQIPSQVAAWAVAAQQQTGVSDLAAALALSTTGPDSSINPNAVGKAGEIGLTQLLPIGGLGAGYPSTTLYDPVQNLAIAMTAIQQRLNMSGGDTWFALQPWATRAADLAGLSDAQAALAAAQGGPAGVVAIPTPSGSVVAVSPVLLLGVAVVALALLDT